MSTPYPWPAPPMPTPWGYRGTDYGETDPGDPGVRVRSRGQSARPMDVLMREFGADEPTEEVKRGA